MIKTNATFSSGLRREEEEEEEVVVVVEEEEEVEVAVVVPFTFACRFERPERIL